MHYFGNKALYTNADALMLRGSPRIYSVWVNNNRETIERFCTIWFLEIIAVSLSPH